MWRMEGGRSGGVASGTEGSRGSGVAARVAEWRGGDVAAPAAGEPPGMEPPSVA